MLKKKLGKVEQYEISNEIIIDGISDAIMKISSNLY